MALVFLTLVLPVWATGPAEERATSQASTAGAGPFPVTIEHAFGATVIEEAPERVVAWGWGAADAAIALGVVPVAIPFQGYGGDEQGVLPWIRQRLEADGEEIPAVLPDSSDPPFEAIAAARPDAIIAPYSGITAEHYDLLAQIAPTVAYPDQPWATPWRENIRIVGSALGKAQVADAILADIDAQVASRADAHPGLAGKSVALVWDVGSTFYVYKPADARVEFTEDLGMVTAQSVRDLAGGEATFYYTLSHERLAELSSDVLVSYASTQEESDAFLKSDYAQLMEQVRVGAVAEVVGTEFIASVSPPTALSLTWGLDTYVGLLADAAKARDAHAQR